MSDAPEAPVSPSDPASKQAGPEVPLPSTASLGKASAIAAFGAAALLVAVVLPAEYNIDPTGVGGAIGLTVLSDPEGSNDEGAPPSGMADAREDSVIVEVPAGGGVEYKFSLKTGDKMVYSWEVEGDGLFFDFHGEPKSDTTGFFESYAVGTMSKSNGTFTAPFEGVHGWYWKNNGYSVARVSLVTSGTYGVVGLR